MIMSYKDLDVYKVSYQCVIEVYKLTKSFPKEEMFALASQIKRASYSIPLNIAEGYGRKSSGKEFKRFLQMALGSANEMQVILELSKDLGYVSEDVFSSISAEYVRVVKMLRSLIQKTY